MRISSAVGSSADTVKSLVDKALNAGVKILGREEMPAYLLDIFMKDISLRDIHRDQDNNFRISVEQKIDEFIDKLQTTQERIPGYSRFDTNTFCSEYKHSEYSFGIKEKIVDILEHDLNEAFSALENIGEKARKNELTFSEQTEKNTV